MSVIVRLFAVKYGRQPADGIGLINTGNKRLEYGGFSMKILEEAYAELRRFDMVFHH